MLAGVEVGDVDVDEPHAALLEGGARGGGEVAPPGADPDHHVGGTGQVVGCGGAGRTDRPHLLRVTVRQRPLARLSLPDRDPGGVAQGQQGVLGAGVVHAAAGDDHRPPGRSDDVGRALDPGRLRGRSAMCQVRSANSSTGQSWASACTSCGSATVTAPVSTGSVNTRIAPSSATRKLLGPGHPVEEPGQGPERVVDGEVAAVRLLELLQTGAATRVAKVSEGSNSAGSRLVVARAAPVSMLVEPGPTDAVHTGLQHGPSGGRRPPTRGPSPARYEPGSKALSVRPASMAAVSCCCSAWPIPATLPWPKMPKTPAMLLPLAVARCMMRTRNSTVPGQQSSAWCGGHQATPCLWGIGLWGSSGGRSGCGSGARRAGGDLSAARPTCREPSRGPDRR